VPPSLGSYEVVQHLDGAVGRDAEDGACLVGAADGVMP
jgi:hypothetical protein